MPIHITSNSIKKLVLTPCLFVSLIFGLIAFSAASWYTLTDSRGDNIAYGLWRMEYCFESSFQSSSSLGSSICYSFYYGQTPADIGTGSNTLSESFFRLRLVGGLTAAVLVSVIILEF